MAPTTLLNSFGVLGAQALVPIVLGSFQSLRMPASVRARRRAARRLDKTRLLGGADDDDEEDEEILDETLTLADSVLFPILGSAALLGLWLLLKYVDKTWIDLVLGVYFSGAGVFAVHSTFDQILSGVLRILGLSGPTYHVRVSAGIRQVFHAPMRVSSCISVLPALALPALYILLDRPYVLTNVLALCLGTAALGLIRLDGYPTAVLLLSLLLIYDIFWVFYTPVMVTVAKGIDAPIKLMAPKTGGAGFAMLGLGDVVVPGLLIALMLRFDMGRHVLRNPRKDVTPRSAFPTPYFFASLVSYIAGLCATVYAMTVQNRAQPALLYLSPACIAGPALLAVLKGELGLLWGWKEEEESEVRDETIEAPSEVAQRARAEAQADSVVKPAEAVVVEEVVEVVPEPVDDSWMESGTPAEKTPRKRKGGKRK